MKLKKMSVLLSFAAAGVLMFSSVIVPCRGLALADEAPAQTEKATLKITGPMHVMCTSCQGKVRARLDKVDGVKSVTFNTKKGTADVTYVTGKTSPEALAQAVSGLGKFKASVVAARAN